MAVDQDILRRPRFIVEVHLYDGHALSLMNLIEIQSSFFDSFSNEFANRRKNRIAPLSAQHFTSPSEKMSRFSSNQFNNCTCNVLFSLFHESHASHQ